MKTKDPLTILENISNDTRQLHANVRALRILAREMEAALLIRLKTTQASPTGRDAFNVSNMRGPMTTLVDQLGSAYANTKLVLQLAENSEAFKSASAQIDPLLEEIAQLEDDE